MVFNLIHPALADFTNSSGLGSAAGQAGYNGAAKALSIDAIIGNVVLTGMGLVGVVFFVLMIYSGYLWLTSEGDDKKVKSSQKMLTAAVIGMIIVFSAYAVTSFVGNILPTMR